VSALRRLPLPLMAAGAGLIVASLHGGSRPAPAPVAAAIAYVPPPLTAPPAVHPQVRVAPAHHRAAHTAARPAAAARRARGRPAPKPVPTHSAVVHHTVVHRSTTAHVPGPTGWSALNAAIARIPTYRPGAARWVVSSKYDFWGTADWYHDVLYVAPGVPVDKLYDVAVHEWSHELSVLDYRGDVAAATRAMNAAFGGGGLTGPERAADCMAILQGARWTHYTTCTDRAWRAAAARLVAGKQLR
jgi:hypothetical protein